MSTFAPDALECLAAIVEEGGFERAAQRLSITQSAVSQRLRALEVQVGTVLIVRSRPLKATSAGRFLLKHAMQMRLLRADLERDLKDLSPGLLGAGQEEERISIAINADSIATWFIEALQAFCAGGNTLLDVVLDDQDRTSEWLRRGQVLAAVSSLANPVQGCRSRKLGALRYRATASPEFLPRWFGPVVSAARLARAPSLVFDRNDRLQERWVRRVVRKDLALPAHRLPSSQAFVDATLAGIGWGMNPVALVREHLASGRLVELLPDRRLDTPLYWQVAQLPLPELARLSQCVLGATGLESGC